jgi:GMP synthase-like glutamine amidotransferase
MKTLTVIQHTSADYLGLMEDHLEGRRIRFAYVRPFTEATKVPDFTGLGDGLVLLGGGPWGSAGGRNVPTLGEEIGLARACLMHGMPVIGIGLGAQILAIAADGSSEACDLRFKVGRAHRTRADALNGYLPEAFPHVCYMRDRPEPPDYAQVLAVDDENRPAIFQIGGNAFGFTGHPGFKLAMAEDLIMEFEEVPPDTADGLAELRAAKAEIEDALVPIMTGLVQLTGLMRA